LKLEFELIPSLPRLAWAAQLQKNQNDVRVLHGPWVETRKCCFFEGAWDGPFDACRFDLARTFMGSGGRVSDDAIVFAGPTHTCERLFSVRSDDGLFVSNSLAFLLTLSGNRLDPKYAHYYLDFLDYRRAGIRMKEKRLRLDGPRVVELHDCCNVAIDPASFEISRVEKPLGTPPRSYEDYVGFLSRTAEQVMANSRDGGRQWAYRPVTSLSQGYDTTAVSALATKAGCREAVTFAKSNSTSGYVTDSGLKIASCLGLRITEYERTDLERIPQRRDYEFYIDPDGVDRALALMEKQLTGALFFTGKFGERLWSREPGTSWGLPGDTGQPDFQLRTVFRLGGYAMGEFRLKTGFIHFPLLSSGAMHAPAIKTITWSRAMDPWSVGGSYDRPIARRIAEEAGVPRHLFGQVKKGGARRSGPRGRNWIGRMVYLLWRATYWVPIRLLIMRLTGNRLNPAWTGSFEVQRGAERLMADYRSAISEAPTARESAAAEHSTP
jgi:hypothetical protein